MSVALAVRPNRWTPTVFADAPGSCRLIGGDMAQGTCEHCDRPAGKRGWCTLHYQRWRNHGDPLYVGRKTKADVTLSQFLNLRFDRSADPDACWPWTGPIGDAGYGLDCSTPGIRARAHRSVYEMLVGPIPVGLQLDHTCHDPEVCRPDIASDCPHRRCVNPAHLEPVTQQVNISRGGGMTAKHERQTHCIRGHSLGSDGDVHIDPKRNNRRSCRECRREYDRRRYPERQAKKRVA